MVAKRGNTGHPGAMLKVGSVLDQPGQEARGQAVVTQNGQRKGSLAVAGIVHHEDGWQLCRDELTGVDVRVDGWDIRGR